MASIDDVIRLLEAARDHSESPGKSSTKLAKNPTKKAPRKASAYSKKYAKAFKQIAPKHKKRPEDGKQAATKKQSNRHMLKQRG